MKDSKFILSCLLLAAFAFSAQTLRAVESKAELLGVNDHFDPKINNWAEGTLMSVDVDGSKFSIRGTKRPYASAYAKMMTEINQKTMKLSAEDSAKKIDEIRAAWQPELEKARTVDAGTESTFTFHLPGKDGTFKYYDESAHYGIAINDGRAIAASVKLTDAEQLAMKALKDLKVGEFFVVGYDGGLISNDAYVLIKARAGR